MYPSETSLLPVTASLTQFISKHGIFAFSLWYDEWFAGMPFRYATEPLVPMLIAALHRLTQIPIFDSVIYFVVISWLISNLGWGIFVSRMTSIRWGGVTFILLCIFPWHLFSSLAFTDASFTFARALVPYVLVSFISLLNEGEDKRVSYFLSTLMFALILLSSLKAIPVVIVGVVALIVAITRQENGVSLDTSVRRISIVFGVSFLLSTLWYGFEYWVAVLSNPSLGGNTFLYVIRQLGTLARASLPLLASVMVVLFSKSLRRPLFMFTAVWTGTFLFITGYRFVSDYDFWMDWSIWFTELEIGLVVISLNAMMHKVSLNHIAKSFALFIVSVVLTLFIYRAIGSPSLINHSIPEPIKNANAMIDGKSSTRTFMSGSDVFWIPSLMQIAQLRGGSETAASNPYWDHASFQIREGESPKITSLWLQIYGIDTILLHTRRSANYFHDFRYIEKWDTFATKVDDHDGDVLYIIPEQSLGWVVDGEVLSVNVPDKGDDENSLVEYLSYRQSAVSVSRVNSSEYTVTPVEGEYVQLAITYHSGWEAIDGEGNQLVVTDDPLGFLIIKPVTLAPITLTFSY